MDKEKYLLNGTPISAKELIKEAQFFDDDFKASAILQTSVAARILREHGYTVLDNPDAL
jgi:hypothetical protein